MKAVLDHVGIAVTDLEASLAFFRDALGLEVERPEDVPSQRVRAQFLATGPSSLELLQATSPDSPIAKFLEKRGPGAAPHHAAGRRHPGGACSNCAQRNVRLIDEEPRPGAGGASVAFIHPSSAQGVLVELKQVVPVGRVAARTPQDHSARRYRDRDRVGRLLLSRRRRDVRRDPEDVLGEEGPARRAQPHSDGDAVSPRARRANHAHRRRRRRQDDRQAGGHLPLRARLQPVALASGRRRVARRRSTSSSRRTCTSITREASPSARRGRRDPAAVPAGAIRGPPRRVGRCDAPERAHEGQLLPRELPAARGPQRAAAGGRGCRDHARRARAAHRRAHDAPPDGDDRVCRQDRGLRRPTCCRPPRTFRKSG